jgi:HSP20 family protein
MTTTVRENRSGNGDRAQMERFVAPISSVAEDGEGYALQVEMPGVNKEGLEISVENNELTIIGRRSLPPIDGALIHRESRSEDFRRTFELDPSIDTDKISAKIDHGVVTLTLPKAEQVKPRRIAVK